MLQPCPEMLQIMHRILGILPFALAVQSILKGSTRAGVPPLRIDP